MERQATIKDFEGKCRFCGKPAYKTDAIFSYGSGSYVRGNRRITESGIFTIYCNYGYCEQCEKERLRKDIEYRRRCAKEYDVGSTPDANLGYTALSIFGLTAAFFLAFKVLDYFIDYGFAAAFRMPAFYIWLGVQTLCIAAGIFAIKKNRKYLDEAEKKLTAELELSDDELVALYTKDDPNAIIKLIEGRCSGSLYNAYASDIMKYNSAEEYTKAEGVSQGYAEKLYLLGQLYGRKQN